MKKNTMIFGLLFLAAAFQWGCERETVTPTDGEVSLRDPGPNHNHGGNNGGGNGGGEEARYEVTYGGTIFSSEVGFYRETRSNPKYNVMNEACGPYAMPTGINEILALNGSLDCFDENFEFCSRFHEIRQ